MLEHFIGSYKLKENNQQAISNSAINRIESLFHLKKFISKDKRLIIYANNILSTNESQDISIDKNNYFFALAGNLGLTCHQQKTSTKSEEAFQKRTNIELLKDLSSANGTFALVAYDEPGTLLLATDSLGARPLYYTCQSGVIYFATSFPLLRDVHPESHQLDIQAVAEQIKFGYPLGNRTLSSNISVLRDGECLIASDGHYYTNQYSDWRQTNFIVRNREQELLNCSNAFNEALRSRITHDPTQFSLLSGGLDSRMIVAKLRDDNYSVIASNRSLHGTLDQQYCEEFSAKNDVTVRYVPWANDRQTSSGMTTAFVLKKAMSSLPSNGIFSGDGGGEVYGFMMFDKEFYEALKTDGLKGAIDYYSSKQTISKHIVTRKFSEDIDRLAHEGLTSEFKRVENLHPEKASQLFFILNELRSHLHEYFNSTDPEAKELLLPFYDRRVLESVIKIQPPFDQYIGHRFYYDLLPYVSSRLISVAWQAYPFSEPCPITSKCNGINQWEQSQQTTKLEAKFWRKRAIVSTLTSKRIPFIRYYKIFAIFLLDSITKKNHSYIFKQYEALKEIYLNINK